MKLYDRVGGILYVAPITCLCLYGLHNITLFCVMVL